MDRKKTGWLVRVYYMTGGGRETFGDFAHGQKAKAMLVYRKLSASAHRVQVYRAGTLQFETAMDRLIVGSVSDLASFLEHNSGLREGVSK